MTAPDAPASARWRDWSCTVTVVVTDPGSLAGARQTVADVMAEVETAVSRFRPDSDLERVHRHAGVLVPVKPLTFHLVRVALDAAADTDGAVDPTVGSDLIRLGYDADISLVRRRPAAVPSPSGSARPSWLRVSLDDRFRRVGVPEGVRLDLGATAKAWTADEAARRVHERFGGAVLVGIGGDLAAIGTPARAWQIDVAESEGEPRVRVSLSGGGLATSSTTGRTWRTTTGERLHHVISPRTGLPVQGTWRTATVWAPTALVANVMSTWALVDADAAARRIADRRLAARLLGREGRVTRLGSWPTDSHGEAA